jgi:ankyrin repeat protein
MYCVFRNSNPEAVTTLLEAGAEVNARDELAWTPLMIAAYSSRNPEVIKALLDAGAATELKSDEGKTALDYARENKYLTNVEAFAEAYRKGSGSERSRSDQSD